MLRVAAGLAVLLIAAPAWAGEPYQPPKVTPAGRVQPPADLLADVATLRQAVAAADVGAVAPFIAPTVTILNGAIDLHVPRRADPLGPFLDARAALIELGQNTGGDWDASDDADLNGVLVAHALEFWGWSLAEDDLDWGLDPMAPDAICTYEAQVFDPAEVARVAEQLGINSSAFFMVDEKGPRGVSPTPGAAGLIDFLKPGWLYALDYEDKSYLLYDAESYGDEMAMHLPKGGTGFITFPDEGMLRPYMTGLCFEKGAAGRWQVTVQTNTSL